MIKNWVMAIICLLTFQYTMACDICGCGVSNFNPYLFPHLSSSYLSFTYAHKYYHTFSETGTLTKEYYNTIMMAGQFSPAKNWQVMAMLPYQMNRQQGRTAAQKLQGIGDAILLANYKVFDKLTPVVRHTFMAGGGIKLPTGRYHPVNHESRDEANFQLGTGSVDYLMNASYKFSYRKWVLSTSGSYKLNTPNSDTYRFGNVWNTGVTAIYRYDWTSLSIAPYVMVMEEASGRDARNHYLREHTGGHVLYAGGGVDINTKNLAVGFNYQYAAAQQVADGQIEVKPRFLLHVAFLLPSKKHTNEKDPYTHYYRITKPRL